MTQKELIDRGDGLAEKHTETELKEALKDALAMGDSMERLALQWALKKKTKTKDGYAFTKEQETKTREKLKI